MNNTPQQMTEISQSAWELTVAEVTRVLAFQLRFDGARVVNWFQIQIGRA